MRPIKWLIGSAILVTLLVGALLYSTALMVASGIDEAWLSMERQRAATIADMLAVLTPEEQDGALAGYAKLTGLKKLHVAGAAATDENHPYIPLLEGPLRGKFLIWEGKRPGQVLFERFAPSRMPMIGSMIVLVILLQIGLLMRAGRMEQARRQAQWQAMRDPLTGLPNRLALDTEMRQLSRGQRTYSVLALDLDRFKTINDNHGHAAGDLALRLIGERLGKALSENEMLARVGGDEFVILVLRGGNRAALAGLARNIIATVAQPIAEIAPQASVGVSLGIVENGNEHLPGAVLKMADRALYDAKRLNGDAFCFAGSPGQDNSEAELADFGQDNAPLRASA